MDKWTQPKPVSIIDMGFGPENVYDYLPAWDEIPEDFKLERRDAKKWCQIIDDMFFKGVKAKNIVTHNGVDKNKALQHVKSVLHSYDPKHEHKTAGCSYLLSLWFKEFDYEVAPKGQ